VFGANGVGIQGQLECADGVCLLAGRWVRKTQVGYVGSESWSGVAWQSPSATSEAMRRSAV